MKQFLKNAVNCKNCSVAVNGEIIGEDKKTTSTFTTSSSTPTSTKTIESTSTSIIKKSEEKT